MCVNDWFFDIYIQGSKKIQLLELSLKSSTQLLLVLNNSGHGRGADLRLEREWNRGSVGSSWVREFQLSYKSRSGSSRIEQIDQATKSASWMPWCQ